MNQSTRRPESGALARKSIWLKALAFAGLGALLMILYLLPGCGSESNPQGAVSGKNKTAARQDKKATGAVPFVLEQGSAKEPKARNAAAVEIAKLPNQEILPGIDKKEMDARNAAAAEIAKTVEILPGITAEEMRVRNAQAAEIAKSPGLEILPGITKEEMDARNAAALKMPWSWDLERRSQESKQGAALTPAKPPLIPKNQNISPPAGGK